MTEYESKRRAKVSRLLKCYEVRTVNNCRCYGGCDFCFGFIQYKKRCHSYLTVLLCRRKH